MNPIEKTIRNALEKGDPTDRAFREKVYRSVHSALERSLQNNPELPEATVQQRRAMLKESIRSIESEFVPARMSAAAREEEPEFAPEARISPDHQVDEPVAEEMPVPNVSDPRTAEPEHFDALAPDVPDRRTDPHASADFPIVEPRLHQDERGARAPEPELGVERRRREPGRQEPSFGDLSAQDRSPAGSVDEISPELRGERREPTRRRGRSYAVAFFAVTLLAAIGMGVWWTVDQGLLRSAEERDTGVPNPPLALEDEEFVPEDTTSSPPLSGVAEDTTQWITIFDPSDPTRVAAPAGGEAAVVDSESGAVLRIRTSAADEPIVFDVGQGVLDQIAGRRAVFDIVAGVQEGEPTQISVTCDFGDLGDCGRRRFDVSGDQSDHLFNLEIPAGEPSGAGTIAIISDVEDQGRAVDIREIRVSIQD